MTHKSVEQIGPLKKRELGYNWICVQLRRKRVEWMIQSTGCGEAMHLLWEGSGQVELGQEYGQQW